MNGQQSEEYLALKLMMHMERVHREHLEALRPFLEALKGMQDSGQLSKQCQGVVDQTIGEFEEILS